MSGYYLENSKIYNRKERGETIKHFANRAV